MRLVLGIHSLASVGGVESYVTTVGDQLQRSGHEVWVYAKDGGPSAEIADSLGLRVVRRSAELPATVDAMLPQDTPSALELAAAFPETPQVFVSHSDNFDVNLPPMIPGLTRCIVTLYERAHARMGGLALIAPLERLRQPVDVDRFKPTRALPERAAVALSLGNYLTGPRLELVREACARAGLEFRHAGLEAGGVTTRPEDAFNAADVVFGKAKVVHEAMACGRAVYVLDHNGAEGWVTAENYAELAADNFGGQSHPRPVNAERLAADLDGYDAAMGFVNRDLIVANHSAVRHAAELVEVIRRHVGSPAAGMAAPDAGGLIELARLTRVNWRHEGDAYRLRSRLERESADRAKLESELAAARERIKSLENGNTQ